MRAMSRLVYLDNLQKVAVILLSLDNRFKKGRLDNTPEGRRAADLT